MIRIINHQPEVFTSLRPGNSLNLTSIFFESAFLGEILLKCFDMFSWNLKKLLISENLRLHSVSCNQQFNNVKARSHYALKVN